MRDTQGLGVCPGICGVIAPSSYWQWVREERHPPQDLLPMKDLYCMSVLYVQLLQASEV